METVILTAAFLASAAVASAVTASFSSAIDGVLARVLTGELSQAWSRCAKFAVFTASFTAGLRVKELANFLSMRVAPMGSGEGLLEVFKSVASALSAASVGLLAFFGAVLLVTAAKAAFRSLTTESRSYESQLRSREDRQSREERHPAAAGH